jgi:hypothetical protein
MFGDQVVDEPGNKIEFPLRRAVLEDDITVDDVAALGKVSHDSGVGSACRDEPDAIDSARLGERAGLQEGKRRGGNNNASEDRQRITSLRGQRLWMFSANRIATAMLI